MRTWIQLENKHPSALPGEFQADDVRYAESLVAYFLTEFTQANQIVFDPFAGYGTTLLVAEAMGRIPFGLEYDQDRVNYIQTQLKQPQNIQQGDARQLNTYALPTFDFSMTSPPYMKEGDLENPFTAYREEGAGYVGYLQDIQSIYQQLSQFMRPKATVVIEVANLKAADQVTTLAWDVAKAVSQVLHFEGEVIVNWDHYGYGYQHSYCLVFKKSS